VSAGLSSWNGEIWSTVSETTTRTPLLERWNLDYYIRNNKKGALEETILKDIIIGRVNRL